MGLGHPRKTEDMTKPASPPSRRALLGGGVMLGLARPHLALAQA